jgi:mannose-6-phosphate isomerase-like protein (cupin superfamily)
MNTTKTTEADSTCPVCRGTGRYEFADPDCPQCNGKGFTGDERGEKPLPCRCRRWVECGHFREWDKPEKYAAQSDIVSQALATPTHSLNELLRLMRRSGQTAVYLSGTRLDNGHCFGSDDVGMLFSVLPEDSQKAAEPGYHPGSTEVYVTFQGSLIMECLEDGQVTARTVGANEVLVLPAGQCHRVRFDRQGEAASVIIKTNLRAKPGVVRCAHCTYYPDSSACPLFQRWRAEAGSR